MGLPLRVIPAAESFVASGICPQPTVEPVLGFPGRLASLHLLLVCSSNFHCSENRVIRSQEIARDTLDMRLYGLEKDIAEH